MITEENKEAIRERIQAGLADLEAQLENAEKAYMHTVIKEAIDKNKAILQELDANAAYGTSNLANMALEQEEKRAYIADLEALKAFRQEMLAGDARRNELLLRSVQAAEKQASAFERIADHFGRRG